MTPQLEWIDSVPHSRVARISYHPGDRLLTVIYRDGRRRVAHNVDPVTFQRLKASQSKQSFIHREVLLVEVI